MTKGGRYYEDMNPREAASTILRDIVNTGRSIGWKSKESETLSTMKEFLLPYNVQYVSDFDGRWEHIEPRNTCFTPAFKPGQKVYWYDGNNDGAAVAEVERIIISDSGLSYELTDKQHSGYFTLSESALFESPAGVYDRRIALIRKDIQLLEEDIAILEEEKREIEERGEDE